MDEKALDALDALDEAKHLHATLTEAVEAAEMRHKDATESQKLASCVGEGQATFSIQICTRQR